MTSRDNYDGDVDSDCDDVTGPCVRRRRRRRGGTARRRRLSTSAADPVVVSSDSDQSPPPPTSRDRRSVDVTLVSSVSDARPGGGEADSQRSLAVDDAAADVERSPVLFSEPLT